jgi:manganese/zinc/iron transport system substrate-binding protein
MLEVAPEKRFLITNHDAFSYFAKAYLASDDERSHGGWQKRFAAPEGLAPDSQLSSTDIRQVLNHIKAYNIKVIFPESNVSQASIRKLLSAGNEDGLSLQIAAEPLYGDAMGKAGTAGDTYLKMIRHNVETIKSYLNSSGAAHAH